MDGRIRMRIGGESATISLYDRQAPNMCRKILGVLPLKTVLLHAKFAGPEIMLRAPLFCDGENMTTRQEAGNVCYNDSSQTICIFYEDVPGMGPCTLFGKITENLEGIQREGRKGWRRQGTVVEITRM